jgi:hypothetical protein
MKQKYFFIGLVLLLIFPVTIGCGVSKGEYDNVKSELDGSTVKPSSGHGIVAAGAGSEAEL